MGSPVFHCLLDLPIPSMSCHVDKCLGVLRNEASFFISVNIYREAVSRSYFQSTLAYKDSARNPCKAWD